MQSIITVNQTNARDDITSIITPRPNDNDVEDLEDLSSLAADGLIRLRDHPEDERPKESVRFAQESLHSYRFSSSTSATTRTDLAEIRKSLMNRSIDFMKHKSTSLKTPDTLPAHYHPSTLLNNDDTNDLAYSRSKTKSVGYSPVASFNVEQYRASRRRRRSNPMPDIQEGKLSRPASPVTPDDVDLVTEQLKHLNHNSHHDHHHLSHSNNNNHDISHHTESRAFINDTNISSSSYSSYSSSSSSESDSNPSTAATTPTPPAPTTTKRPGIQRKVSTSANIFPHPALHNTSRFLPQNQAILTTYDDWRVILSNDIAALVLVGIGGSCRGLVGKSVVDFIEPSYRNRFLDMVTRRREELSHLEDSTGGMVLVCGNVLPIVKQDGSRSAASLWLKEKRNDAGSPVYIWIFEEVFETVTHITVNMQGIIQYTDECVHELYGYEPGELIGKSVDMLIPSLNHVQDISRLRFFGSRTKLGAHFPIIAKIHTVSKEPECFTLRITSIPMIAGLVTIRKDGTIEGCNAVFARYMFGLSQEELVATDIADLMPQIPTLLSCLQRDDLLQHGIIINSLICRKLIADMDNEKLLSSLPNAAAANNNNNNKTTTSNIRRLTHAPNGQILPVLLAVHRDKTPFEIQLQLKLVEGSDDLCALWITFDREATFSRCGHINSTYNPPLEIKQHDGLGLPAAKRPPPPPDPAPDSQEPEKPLPAAAASETTTTTSAAAVVTPSSPQSIEEKAEKSKQEATTAVEERPSRIITSFSRPTYISASQTPGAAVPSSPISPCTPRSRPSSRPPSTQVVLPDYSAQTNATTIDDYTILDNLGQGAYGLVKLAVKRDDPEQKKVVIKYVIKSRILVDCWTKDRKLGVIPVEIHILHTLRKIPHKNCSDMLDYFEDDDHYYIVMGLHGVGMDLFDYIELKNGMMDDEIRDIFKQIAEAVRHLHDNKIVHRDIKDENVVLDQNGGVRLIDFGSAAYLKGRRYDTFVGTLDYAAPEILAGQTYEGPAQDIWALGILLYTLVYRENPFYDIDEILSHELRVPFVLSDGSLGLIKKMLDRNVDQRPNIHAVLAHPWLN
ncbi:hypothetical protein BDB00DRAFT_873852 [Zychaea mexicana]|uniref:uncharacterized protein n=1 Tax=Zychaea mexicana TaxID=64656 RepID=UPI0022FE6DDC|nr:uncharacterized protein BDB00DRAFT_873852 [Zychaea mexicana]KAI9492015.1 hypothetical protein BDB00DRAFT_873852 [Zychaea mexicana]